MSNTKKEAFKFLGYRFYKENQDDEYHIIRLIKIYPYNDKICTRDEETGNTKVGVFSDLTGYTPLSPYGLINFTSVFIGSSVENRMNDVIVFLYKNLDIKMGNDVPYAICRQSVTDFYYTLISKEEEHQWVGVSANRDDCPTNIPYHNLAGCSGINKMVTVNYYLDDTVDTILECMDTKPFDTVLGELYHEHVLASKNPFLANKDTDHGWCKTLRKLLYENNFITDLDELRNITAVDFNIDQALEVDENNISHFCKEARLFFNMTFKLNAIDIQVMKYGMDIDLAEFNHSNYTLLRDNTNTTYVCVYKIEGQYLEEELIAEANKLSVSDKYRLAFYNKYGK